MLKLTNSTGQGSAACGAGAVRAGPVRVGGEERVRHAARQPALLLRRPPLLHPPARLQRPPQPRAEADHERGVQVGLIMIILYTSDSTLHAIIILALPFLTINQHLWPTFPT